MVKEYIDAMYEYLDNQNFWQLHSQLISKKYLNAELAERVTAHVMDEEATPPEGGALVSPKKIGEDHQRAF